MIAQMTQASDPTPPIVQPLLRRVAGLSFLVALADWLFYEHKLGISVVIFLAALCAVAMLSNRLNASLRASTSCLAAFGVAVLPLIEDPGLISILIAATGAVIFALGVCGNLRGRLGERVGAVAKTLLLGPIRLAFDLPGMASAWKGFGKAMSAIKSLAVWVIPLAFGAVFLLLFASANPLISLWFSEFDLPLPRLSVSPLRVGFWIATIFAVWPFLYVKSARVTPRLPSAETPSAPQSGPARLLFGPAAILRSLALFNILFAAQSGLDITYLWAGVSLPSGLTYASYAHQGAYPLIATALLAAGFVLAALRRGSEASEVRSIKVLIVIWIAQNILLVTSSILRLDLYVVAYSLTWLRFTAFVWMVLVAAGLVLILVRIALNRPNRWLIGANCCTVALAVHVTSLLNVPSLIARYNVDHCREISGVGVQLDLFYLIGLGPSALPAIDRYLAFRPEIPMQWREQRWQQWRSQRSQWVSDLLISDWRSWGFREERLRRYLARRQAILGASRGVEISDSGGPQADGLPEE